MKITSTLFKRKNNLKSESASFVLSCSLRQRPGYKLTFEVTKFFDRFLWTDPQSRTFSTVSQVLVPGIQSRLRKFFCPGIEITRTLSSTSFLLLKEFFFLGFIRERLFNIRLILVFRNLLLLKSLIWAPWSSTVLIFV